MRNCVNEEKEEIKRKIESKYNGKKKKKKKRCMGNCVREKKGKTIVDFEWR